MTKEIEKEGKPARRRTIKPLGVPTDKLEVTNQQANMHYVWVNLEDLTLQAFEEAGYEYVMKDDPERVSSADMTGTAGGIDSRYIKTVSRGGQKQCLMRIPTDEWERQQKLRDEAAMEPLETVLSGGGYQFDGSYVKQAKVTSSKGRGSG